MTPEPWVLLGVAVAAVLIGVYLFVWTISSAWHAGRHDTPAVRDLTERIRRVDDRVGALEDEASLDAADLEMATETLLSRVRRQPVMAANTGT